MTTPMVVRCRLTVLRGRSNCLACPYPPAPAAQLVAFSGMRLAGARIGGHGAKTLGRIGDGRFTQQQAGTEHAAAEWF